MIWIFVTVAVLDMKLSFFHEFLVFNVWISALTLKLLFNYFILNQMLWLFKVIHWRDNLCISGNNCSFDVHCLRSYVVLNPWRSILTVRSLIKSIFSVSRKCTSFSIIHKKSKIYNYLIINVHLISFIKFIKFIPLNYLN
jgi:hypothetical protein